MKWHLYKTKTLFFGWEYLETLDQALMRISESEDDGISDKAQLKREEFYVVACSAREEAKKQGWEHIYENKEYILRLPCLYTCGFICAFIFKQGINEDAIIVSPKTLSYLEEEMKDLKNN